MARGKWIVEAVEHDLKYEDEGLFLTAENAAGLLGPQLSGLVSMQVNPFPCDITVTDPAGRVTEWVLDRQLNWDYHAALVQINNERTN